jgi:hypothetical protein
MAHHYGQKTVKVPEFPRYNRHEGITQELCFVIVLRWFCPILWLCFIMIYLSIYPSIHLCIYLSIYSPLLDLGRSFSFLNFYTDGRTPWARDQPVGRPLPEHKGTQQNKHRQTSMPQVGFEPTTPMFKPAKIIDALERAATVTSSILKTRSNYSCSQFLDPSPPAP